MEEKLINEKAQEIFSQLKGWALSDVKSLTRKLNTKADDASIIPDDAFECKIDPEKQ